MIFPTLRKLAEPIRMLPVHPQWLMRFNENNIQSWILGYSTSGCVLNIGSGNRTVKQFLPDSFYGYDLDYPATHGLGYTQPPHVYADARRLPFPDNHFDIVTLLDVLEHIADPELAIHECARVTKPGGNIFIQTPFAYPLHDMPHDYQRWTSAGLYRLGQREALVVDNITHYGSPVATGSMLQATGITQAWLLSVKNHKINLILLPVVAMYIVLTNLLGWAIMKILPDSDFLPTGYQATFTKPQPSAANQEAEKHTN